MPPTFEDSDDAVAPGRTLDALARAKQPVALIASALDAPRQLEALLRWHGPVAHFPSLSHFCSAVSAGERWFGVVVARASAWDARLDGCVADRSRVALFGRALSREWPEGVRRLATMEQAEAWLRELRGEPPTGPSLEASSLWARNVAPAWESSRRAKSRRARAKAQVPASSTSRGRTRGDYLLLGVSSESTLGLLNTLRRARPARHAQSVSELPRELLAPEHWTGVLLLHEPADEARALVRDAALVGVWRAPTQALPLPFGRFVEDEPSLLTWMAHTIAYEHTGCTRSARAVEHMAIEYGLSPQQVEVLAVATRTSALEERAELLSTSLAGARAALKDLCDAARGVPVARLVARAHEHED